MTTASTDAGPVLLTETADFRTYEPGILRSDDEGGHEELIGGRWEPFYGTPVRANSEAAAREQMDRWLAKTAAKT